MEYKIIFWDFDGVIKDSVDVKTEAFVNLFSSSNDLIKKKIKLHHENNGGMSRYDKIPIYLEYMKLHSSQKLIEKYSDKFSELVSQKVISSPWVPGVLKFLKNKKKNQLFIITSATPQNELIYILKSIKIFDIFDGIFGSPIKKYNAIKNTLKKYDINSRECLMFGDAKQDYDAAMKNDTDFILRIHESNQKFRTEYQGKTIRDFNDKIW